LINGEANLTFDGSTLQLNSGAAIDLVGGGITTNGGAIDTGGGNLDLGAGSINPGGAVVGGVLNFDIINGNIKNFDIIHPTKKEPWRLRYSVLEGPEIGVYVRGRLTDNNIIELPYYWTDLVHEDSITVTLTSIGKHQNLYVVSTSPEKVIIGIEEGNIDCYYVVYGERKDVDKLITEYIRE
jgi:hypothetical protein